MSARMFVHVKFRKFAESSLNLYVRQKNVLHSEMAASLLVNESTSFRENV